MMFTGFDKAIGAFLASLLTVLTANGVDVPGWITGDWITAFVAVAAPVVVYFWPNKA